MGRSTGIAWTRSTRNFWSGCTKVGPGCDGCYAEAFNRFTRGKNETTGQAMNWGPGAPRIEHLRGAMKDLRKWNAICAIERETGRVSEKDKSGWTRPGYWPVFLNSHSDMFDNEVPQIWREHACIAMEECSNLTFFLVTKRVGNVEKMVPEEWMSGGFPENVRLIVTVVNQDEADRDVPKLLELPCKNGVSYEPAIGSIDFRRIGPEQRDALRGDKHLHWIIIGGESDQAGHVTREFRVSWARSTVQRCQAAGVPVFVKQMGSFVVDRNDAGFDGCEPGAWPLRADGCDPVVEHDIHGHREEYQGADCRLRLVDRAGGDPTEWPEDLRVQEFPA